MTFLFAIVMMAAIPRIPEFCRPQSPEPEAFLMEIHKHVLAISQLFLHVSKTGKEISLIFFILPGFQQWSEDRDLYNLQYSTDKQVFIHISFLPIL